MMEPWTNVLLPLDKHHEIAFIATFPFPGGDFLAAGMRAGGEEVWTVRYRFRYYVDQLVAGSKDRKSHYEILNVPTADLPKMEEIVRTLAAAVGAAASVVFRTYDAKRGDTFSWEELQAAFPSFHVIATVSEN